MKIGIGTTLWQRHDVARLTLSRYARIREELRDEMDIHLVAVGSEGDASQRLAESCGWDYDEFENDPHRLQRKFCRALELLRGADACMLIGSDDFADTKMIRAFVEQIRLGHDFVGQLDYYVVHAGLGEGLYWPGYADRRKGEPVGPFRLMTPDMLDRLNWAPWDNEGNDHDTASFGLMMDAAESPIMLEMKGRYHCFGLQGGTKNQTAWTSIARSGGVKLVPMLEAAQGCTVDELAAIEEIGRPMRRVPKALMISPLELARLEAFAATIGKPWPEWARETLLAVASASTARSARGNGQGSRPKPVPPARPRGQLLPPRGSSRRRS